MPENIESKSSLDLFEEIVLRNNLNRLGADIPNYIDYFEEHNCKSCKKKTIFEYVGIENLSKHTYRYVCIKGHVQVLDLKNKLEKRKADRAKGQFAYAPAY